jgi:predicted transcriptional regulator
MTVHLSPELEKRLNELAAQTGRAAEELVEDAMTGYLDEVVAVRDLLRSRHDDLTRGRVQPIGGDEVFTRLREKSTRRRNRSG